MKSGKDSITQLNEDERATLLKLLKERFESHRERHPELAWAKVHDRLAANPTKLWSLNEMERTGGEPDVIAFDKKSGELTFIDCSPESPAERRSLCYDDQALQARKANKPADSAVNMAAAMGIELLTEEQYRALQELEAFDLKTSSWVKTPEAIRKLGGALFCDRRYEHVFTYHNGADSYYGARGFRGVLKV